MKYILKINMLLSLFLISCSNNNSTQKQMVEYKDTSSCGEECAGENAGMSCKLTSEELRKRKETVLSELRSMVIEKKELPDGFSYKFKGDDEMLKQLVEFIITERECCDFFTFNLSIGGDKSGIWLEIKGREGVKDFIKTELEI